MLQLYKNQVVTSVAKQQIEIRQMELDWYTNNYWTMSQQGALLAGFAFAQITTPLPRSTSFLLECCYLLLSTVAMGMQLCVVVTTTFCCMWGPGLALRGPHGTRSVHLAVDNLRAEQSHVFMFFITGLLTFYLSNLLLLWCYFELSVALASTLILSIFFFLIIYYTFTLTSKLRVSDRVAVFGRVEALRAYEVIGDLDDQYAAEEFSGAEPLAHAGSPAGFSAAMTAPLEVEESHAFDSRRPGSSTRRSIHLGSEEDISRTMTYEDRWTALYGVGYDRNVGRTTQQSNYILGERTRPYSTHYDAALMAGEEHETEEVDEIHANATPLGFGRFVYNLFG